MKAKPKAKASTKKSVKQFDLMPFCEASESMRYAMDKPWRSGEYVYATDGRILIRVDWKRATNAVAPVGRVPDCESLIKVSSGIKDWQPLEMPIDCNACENTSRELETCYQCGGSGKHKCDCGHAHQCGECSGRGRSRSNEYCKKCMVVLFGLSFQARYVRLVAAMPSVQVGVASNNRQGSVFFKFTDGIGILCSLAGE